jgi:hypothetical protein
MRRVTLLVVIAAAMTLGSVQLVQADSASVNDDRGETVGQPAGGPDSVDIVRGAYGHTKSGKLWHKVTIAGQAADPSEADGPVPVLYIDVVFHAGNRECDFFVGRFDGELGVFDCGSLDKVAPARIVRTSEHSTRYVFSPRAIGSPSHYGWAFVTEGPSGDTYMRYDRLPGGDRAYANHELD